MSNYRIFVEKKEGFNLEAKRLQEQIKENLNIHGITNLRLLNCYDIFNFIDSQAELDKVKNMILSEVVTDNVTEDFDRNSNFFAVEYLPGQFDQRADSTYQCMNLISEKNVGTEITTGKVIIVEGDISSTELDAIKKYYINPIEMREKDLNKLEIEKINMSDDVLILEGFINYSSDEMMKFKNEMGLAMSDEDILFIQKYFKDEEKRDPTETEIRVLDTYWSDHCRHTTFETKLKDIVFPKSNFGEILQNTFNDYLKSRENVHGERIEKKYISLMDMATISGKEMRKEGLLDDLEVSEEINACSVFIDVDVSLDEKVEIQKWLLMFKNETHNHPTEIEPFGGASTCLGGAIRDPLSGRSYVYQAIRVTGSGNPLEKISDTLEGKLPQIKITKGAASGYSSYGNQIGLTTTLVSEIYHDDYKAKRMEVGAVVGAVPADYVRRETPINGDLIILLGGKTGRDGCGGATGSSKQHTEDSLALSGSEVQKGNAPEERKIQRLFRRKEVTALIKKCNDFGAGGVSVAIGELADGLDINLDVVPTKYSGLNGTELAISESQERMAVVVAKEDAKKFMEYSAEENLSAIIVAEVTDSNRLVLSWRGKKIVDISRDFLNTNGVTQEMNVEIEDIKFEDSPFNKNTYKGENLKDKWENMLTSLNVASQKGLTEIFDSTIGATTVNMPFGGKYQTTPCDVGIQKIPLIEGNTDTASAITWGYNPNISIWSPYFGGMYAVIESLAKLVSVGVDYKNVRLSFQEYFQKLGKDTKKWGKPFSALLGTLKIQKEFNIPAIGGKDSMSGTFNDINVPPTLISFAVATLKASKAISPEFKEEGNKIYLIKHNYLENFMPNIPELKNTFEFINKNINEGNIISAYSLKFGGVAEAISKMCFGNKIGAKIKELGDEFFNINPGTFIVESKKELIGENVELLGETIGTYEIIVDDKNIDLTISEKKWLDYLAPVFPYELKDEIELYPFTPFEKKKEFKSSLNIAKPRVSIFAFPGTNCEYDTAKIFNEAGAISNITLLRNLTYDYIDESIVSMIKDLENSQIMVIPGGFSAGDEPDGSGKFIAAVLQNEKLKEAINKFLQRDGLILGICNGFQALIKSGLLPYGKLGEITPNSPTLTFNKIGRHISQVVNTKIVSNNSPWLSGFNVGDIHTIPVSHGEGRFFANDEVIKSLFENGQVATQYVNFEGNPTSEFKFNPNGSTMAIEGIFSPDGKIFGKMGHSERVGKDILKNIDGNKVQNIFENGVKYFK